MSDWQSPKVERPPQGVKVLWFDDGNIFVVQRYGDKYLAIIPNYAKLLPEPKLWAHIEFPPGYEGITYLTPKGSDQRLTFDEFERDYPEDHKKFMEMFYEGKFEAKDE
jgi:hypothetical protein